MTSESGTEAQRPGEWKPLVSVVIEGYNEVQLATSMTDVLDGLAKQDYPLDRMELILVGQEEEQYRKWSGLRGEALPFRRLVTLDAEGALLRAQEQGSRARRGRDHRLHRFGRVSGSGLGLRHRRRDRVGRRRDRRRLDVPRPDGVPDAPADPPDGGIRLLRPCGRRGSRDEGARGLGDRRA